MTRFLFLLFVTLRTCCSAQYSTTDIVHYAIRLDNIDYANKRIEGSCGVRVTTSDSNGMSSLTLGLWMLDVDSIVDDSLHTLSFLHDDTTLMITLADTLYPGDTLLCNIYYRGQPQTDPSGWGGFYFTGNYAFNMGVGFESDPHPVGRAWFPAHDIFTDRATYSFHISTPSGYKAFCNGILQSVTPSPNGNTWHWEMNDPIPTYLASIAVAPYHTYYRNYQGIPVEIACMPADTNNVSGTFIHLDSVMSIFSDAYGPYRFDKVGYCLIPFNSGAMEHATSIHIGSSYINGLLTYETLWAHELAHMWWGDWTTCETEGDMWLNEGLASFNEAYITEKLYGIASYRNWFRSNHRKVLQFAHITDNGYLPLINIPHQHTYGPTVYNKGADVARTLRHYMGDSLFFQGARDFMNNKGNGAVNSYHLRDELSSSSGMNLQRFFDDWVFTPGFPHFSIDSVVSIGQNQWNIHLKQKSKGNNHTYEMPVPVHFSNGIQDTVVKLMSDAMTNSIALSLNFNPSFVCIDRFDEMGDAVSDNEKKIFSTGTHTFPETYTTLNVLSIGTDSNTVRMEHHWVAPDPIKNTSLTSGIRIHPERYWSADGIWTNGFHTKTTFIYNGSNNPNAGYMDNSFITGTEDSLVLLYRTGAAGDWQIVNGFTLNAGNKTDKVGNIVVDTLKKGEYALGYRDFTTSTPEGIIATQSAFEVYPNPANAGINFLVKSPGRANYLLAIFDSAGRNVFSSEIRDNEAFLMSTEALPPGQYIARVSYQRIDIDQKTFQVIR